MATLLFRDFSNSFTPNPNTGDISVVTNEAAIKQSIKNLVQTAFRERLHQPRLGSAVADALFDLSTPLTRLSIQKSITETISNYEKRATVLSVAVTDDSARNAYKVNVRFLVNTSSAPVSFDFLLTRIR